MHTAKLFKNGRSQAVRLPKEYALPGDEVYVKRINGVVMLIPKDGDPWGPFVDSLDKFSDDFLSFERDQGILERRDAIKGTICSTPTSASISSRRSRRPY
jgi:antitoxin VapB